MGLETGLFREASQPSEQVRGQAPSESALVLSPTCQMARGTTNAAVSDGRPTDDAPAHVSRPTIFLRPFRPEDAIPACGFAPDYPVMCLTAEVDGNVAAYGGLQLFNGRYWVAFHLADERLRRPMWLHRVMVKGLAAAQRCGISPVYALCDEAVPRSRAWLSALGFRELAAAEKDDEIVMLEVTTRNTAGTAPHTAWIRP